MQNRRVQIDTLDSALQQSDAVAHQGIATALAASTHVTTNGIVKLGIGVAGSNKTCGAGYGNSW